MPDDDNVAIERSSITRAAGGWRTLCKECQHLRSDVLLFFSSGLLDKEQAKVFTALLKGNQVSAAAEGGTSTNATLSQQNSKFYWKNIMIHLIIFNFSSIF